MTPESTIHTEKSDISSTVEAPPFDPTQETSPLNFVFILFLFSALPHLFVSLNNILSCLLGFERCRNSTISDIFLLDFTFFSVWCFQDSSMLICIFHCWIVVVLWVNLSVFQSVDIHAVSNFAITNTAYMNILVHV